MDGARIEFDDYGLRRSLDYTTRAWNAIKRKDRAFIKILWTHAFKDVMDHFDKEEGPDSKWKPIKRKGKILQDTGMMRQSFRPYPYRTTSNEVIFYDFQPYSKMQDEGTKNIPSRKFMWMSSKAMDLLSKDIVTYLGGK